MADTRTPSEVYPLSFATEALELSQVLKTALDNNLDLRSAAFDVAISEKNIMVALGAYDVFMTSSVYASKAETPQRGSQIAFNLGQKQLGGTVGFERKIETGGTINLTVGASRTLLVQPLNVFNAASGTTNLGSYVVAPTLTLTHPLLRNAGLRVNRADIDRAKLAGYVRRVGAAADPAMVLVMVAMTSIFFLVADTIIAWGVQAVLQLGR